MSFDVTIRFRPPIEREPTRQQLEQMKSRIMRRIEALLERELNGRVTLVNFVNQVDPNFRGVPPVDE